MALTFNNLEGGTNGANVATTDTGSGTAWSVVSPGAGGTITYTNDCYYNGKLAIAFTIPTGITGYVERSIVSARSGAFTGRVKFLGLPSTGQAVVSIRTGGGNVVVAISANNSGAVFITDAVGAASALATGTIVTNVWYRVELTWANPSSTTGSASLRIYRGDNTTTPDVTLDLTGQNYGTAGPSNLRLGKASSGGSLAGVIWDDIAYNDGAATAPVLTLPAPDADYLGIRGTAKDVTSGTTTAIDLPNGSSIAIGHYLIARIAADNSGSGGGSPAIAGMVDNASNVWTAVSSLSDPGLANEGVADFLAYAKVTNAYTNGADITITWGTAVGAKSVVVEEWANINTVTPVAVTAVTANGTGTALAVGPITPLSVGQLLYVSTAREGPDGEAFSLDTDTVDGPWLALQGQATEDATATNNVITNGAVKRVTGLGAQTFNSVIASRDWAAIALVFGVPTVATPLQSPTGLTVTPSTTLEQATASWTSVAFAEGYVLQVQELNPGGNPAVEGDWSPLAPDSTFDTTGLGVTMDAADGLEWSGVYRARVTAIADV